MYLVFKYICKKYLVFKYILSMYLVFKYKKVFSAQLCLSLNRIFSWVCNPLAEKDSVADINEKMFKLGK